MKTYFYENDWIIQIRKKMKKRYIHDFIFGIAAFIILFSLFTASPDDYDNGHGAVMVLAPMAVLFHSIYTKSTLERYETIYENLKSNKLTFGETTISGYYCNNLFRKNDAVYFEEEYTDVKGVELLEENPNAGNYLNLVIFCKNNTYKLAVSGNEDAKNELLKIINS